MRARPPEQFSHQMPLSDFAPYHGSTDPLVIIDHKAIQPKFPPSDNSRPCLPGSPRVPLESRSSSELSVERHAYDELATPELDRYARVLWLIATPSSKHISSLTHQEVRGRKIVVTERVRLHCVWIDDRIFLKPVPKWLLSQAFWVHYVERSRPPLMVNGGGSVQNDLDPALQAAKGFLRTWACLVTHETDFRIAQEKMLVPSDISWEAFSDFVSAVTELVDDGQVNVRYHYGDLRLSRLNLWAPFILHKINYQKVHGQYAAYFAHFFAPLFFTIGILSVILTAMQTALAVLDLGTPSFWWSQFAQVSLWFAIGTMILFGTVALSFIGLWATLLLSELRFATQKMWEKRDETNYRDKAKA